MQLDNASIRAAQVVQEQLDAYNRRDLIAFLHYYAPDCRIEDGRGEILFDGHSAIAARYRDMFAHAPQLHAEVAERLVTGPYVVDQEHVTGLPSRDGGERDLDAIVIYRIEDSLIRHVRILS
jgi:putative hydrolase of HD superfamily